MYHLDGGKIEIHTVQSNSNSIGLFSFHFSLNIVQKCRTIFVQCRCLKEQLCLYRYITIVHGRVTKRQKDLDFDKQQTVQSAVNCISRSCILCRAFFCFKNEKLSKECDVFFKSLRYFSNFQIFFKESNAPKSTYLHQHPG